MMPFYQDEKKINLSCYSIVLITNQIQFAPLQVRYQSSRYSYAQSCNKRALSWASGWAQGSLTLEASLCLSLFLFLCVCLMMPMKMMDRQRQIQAVMESVGEELSKYAYVQYCFGAGGKDGVDTGRAGDADDAGEMEDTWGDDGGWGTDGNGGTEEKPGAVGGGVESWLAAGYAAGRIMNQIDSGWVDSVSFDGTDIGTDDMVYIVMNYRMRLPFSVLGLESIPVRQVCSRRMWNGSDGNRHTQGNGAEDGRDEIVYVGKNPTRYHRQRTCHYLYNDLRPVPAGQVEGLRNQSGSRYTPCRTCGSGTGSGTVYIMPYGTSYHSTQTCASIIAYVRSVPLSQVEYLGACSYCGGE